MKKCSGEKISFYFGSEHGCAILKTGMQICIGWGSIAFSLKFLRHLGYVQIKGGKPIPSAKILRNFSVS